jgi:hypothetical protein
MDRISRQAVRIRISCNRHCRRAGRSHVSLSSASECRRAPHGSRTEGGGAFRPEEARATRVAASFAMRAAAPFGSGAEIQGAGARRGRVGAARRPAGVGGASAALMPRRRTGPGSPAGRWTGRPGVCCVVVKRLKMLRIHCRFTGAAGTCGRHPDDRGWSEGDLSAVTGGGLQGRKSRKKLRARSLCVVKSVH